jgi:hypothetical protein
VGRGRCHLRHREARYSSYRAPAAICVTVKLTGPLRKDLQILIDSLVKHLLHSCRVDMESFSHTLRRLAGAIESGRVVGAEGVGRERLDEASAALIRLCR